MKNTNITPEKQGDTVNNKENARERGMVVFLCSLMVFITLGFCSSSNSMYVVPITEALGFSRSAYAAMYSLRYVFTAVLNLFFGGLVLRFGTKKLILVGFAFLILSTLVYSIADELALFGLGSILLGMGLSFTTTTMVGVVINSCCRENKGKYMGFVLATNGVGAAVARTILTPIINSGDEFGFRNSYRLVVLILLAAALLILFLLRDNGKGEKAKPKTEKSDVRTATSITGKPYFYIVLVCAFFTGLILQSVGGIAEPNMRDRGVDIDWITVVFSISSIILSCTKFTTGFLYDKCGLRFTSNICYCAAAITMPLLLLVRNSTIGMILSFAYVIVYAIALPLETVMLPLFARGLFDDASFSKALGILSAVNVAGYAIGGPIANLFFDLTGNYDAWLVISAIAMVAICIGMNIAITLSGRELKKA